MGLHRRPSRRTGHADTARAPRYSGANVTYLQQPTGGAPTLSRAATPSAQHDIEASLGPPRKPTDVLAWREGAERGVRGAPRYRVSEANREISVAGGPSTDNLRGMEVPAVKVDTISRTGVSLRALAVRRLVLYTYPGASGTDGDSTREEDAREHRAYRRCQETLRYRQVRVVALSSQPRKAQSEEWHAHGIDHTMLRDPALELADSLYLPTLISEGERRYGRATLIIEDRIIQHVFCPVERAANNPAQVLAWMAVHGW